MKILRPYQSEADDALFEWLFTEQGHPLVVAPVGAGKSLLIAQFIKRVHGIEPSTRIVVLAHVRELLSQNSKELREYYPDCDQGFYCAGLGQKRLYNKVTFASIQSVHDKINRFNRAPDVVVIDEAHLIPHNESTQYRRFIDSVLALNPSAKVIGFTGTPFRSDSGRLDEGEGKLFDGVAHDIDIGWMISEGYLCKPVVPKVSSEMNVEGVGKSKGDFIASQLQKAVNNHDTTFDCVNEMMILGQGRKKWLVFTAGVDHCEAVRDEIRSRGIACESITGDTENMERSAAIKWFSEKTDETRCLVNVAVLTTGFNVPAIDLLSFMRPTQSPVLYIQCIGRGIRPVYADGYDLSTKEGRLEAIAASDKPDCVVLDFGGVVKRLGPIDAIDIRKKPREGEGGGEAVTKECPSCGAICMAAQRYCYACSHCFASASIERTVDKESAIISEDAEPEVFNVFATDYRPWRKKGADENAPTTLCVTYTTMNGPFREWVCFNHAKGSFAHSKAIAWHKARLPDIAPPDSVNDALDLSYPGASQITVKKDGKFWRILDVVLGEVKETIDFDCEIPF